jgi:hypothetical protein
MKTTSSEGVNARDPGLVPVNSEAEELAIVAITRLKTATAI